MRAVLAAVVSLVLFASPGRADDVTMKDGKVHKDLTLVKENAKTLEFMTLDGKRITLSKDAIAKHEKKETARDVYGVRKKELPPKDAAALFELAKFAKESGMTREARQDFEAVLRLDPNHAGAREGLGQKLLDGKWLSEADAKKVEAERAEGEAKAQGLKKVKDGWVTPVELARMEKGLIKVGPEWVTKEQKKKIDDDKLEYFQGEWVTAADKQKMEGGQRLHEGKWLPVDELNTIHRDLAKPWILRTPTIELLTNARLESGQRYLAILEDAYKGLVELFGAEHPDLYDVRGRLVIVAGRDLDAYQKLGGTFGSPDRVAFHSSKFGAFFAPGFATREGKNKEVRRGAGMTFHHSDEFDGVFLAAALSYAYLDRRVPYLETDEKVVEALAGYIAGMKDGKWFPAREYYYRTIDGRDVIHEKGSKILDRVSYEKEPTLGQAGLFLHYLRTRNPTAFVSWWRRYGLGTPNKSVPEAVSSKGPVAVLVHECLAKDGKVDPDALDADFAAFRDEFRKTHRP